MRYSLPHPAPIRQAPARTPSPIPRARHGRFVAMAMGATVVALTVLCLAINVWNAHLTAERLDGLIELIYENGGIPADKTRKNPQPDDTFQLSPEAPYETRYFIVGLGADGLVESIDASHLASVDEAEMTRAALAIAQGTLERGYTGFYRFGTFEQADGGATVVVLNCFGELQSLSNFRTVSIAVCVACALIVFGLLLPASKRVIAPFVENSERQRRFVTDASHELKTPIAIIAANTDLMEALDGPSTWTQSTRMQTERLGRLVGELVELARADEPPDRTTFEEVDLSELVDDAVEGFEPLAETSGRTLARAVDGGVEVRGSTEELERLAGVLLDNAIKYSSERAEVLVTLRTRRHGVSRMAELAVENPCEHLSAEDAAHLFDRFYRADASRSRETGGYGIGLALARAICTRHGGSIGAQVKGGRVTITAVLPMG